MKQITQIRYHKETSFEKWLDSTCIFLNWIIIDIQCDFSFRYASQRLDSTVHYSVLTAISVALIMSPTNIITILSLPEFLFRKFRALMTAAETWLCIKNREVILGNFPVTSLFTVQSKYSCPTQLPYIHSVSVNKYSAFVIAITEKRLSQKSTNGWNQTCKWQMM